MTGETPAERSLRASLAAHVKWSKTSGREGTAAARAKSPGQLAYWEDQVDPDRRLSDVERRKRAEHAKSAHFKRLALKSAQARRRRAS